MCHKIDIRNLSQLSLTCVRLQASKPNRGLLFPLLHPIFLREGGGCTQDEYQDAWFGSEMSRPRQFTLTSLLRLLSTVHNLLQKTKFPNKRMCRDIVTPWGRNECVTSPKNVCVGGHLIRAFSRPYRLKYNR